MLDWLVWSVAGWWMMGVGLVALSMTDKHRRDFALWEREIESSVALEGLSETTL